MVKHCPWQRVVIQRRRPTVGVTGVVTGVYEDIVIRQAESSDALTCIAVPEEKFLRGRVEVTAADLKLCRSRPRCIITVTHEPTKRNLTQKVMHADSARGGVVRRRCIIVQCCTSGLSTPAQR